MRPWPGMGASFALSFKLEGFGSEPCEHSGDVTHIPPLVYRLGFIVRSMEVVIFPIWSMFVRCWW